MSPTHPPDTGLPLSGVRVLELGQLIAGPFAGQLLGCVTYPLIHRENGGLDYFFYRHFGAEIIKIEPPNTGDPLRGWRELDVDGTSPWFRSLARNKKSVSIDMRKEEGRMYVSFRFRFATTRNRGIKITIQSDSYDDLRSVPMSYSRISSPEVRVSQSFPSRPPLVDLTISSLVSTGEMGSRSQPATCNQPGAHLYTCLRIWSNWSMVFSPWLR